MSSFPSNTISLYTDTIHIPDYFDISVSCNPTDTKITMRVLTDSLTTHHMKHVVSMLKMYLPTILYSQCFNDQNIPFHKEVTRTEVGHLFEHILLEYLCKEKINAGSDEAIFSGVTRWNWNKDKVGTFHITVDVTKQEKELLYFALEQSILLLKRIFYYHASDQTLLTPRLGVTPFAHRLEKQMA